MSWGQGKNLLRLLQFLALFFIPAFACSNSTDGLKND